MTPRRFSSTFTFEEKGRLKILYILAIVAFGLVALSDFDVLLHLDHPLGVMSVGSALFAAAHVINLKT